MVNKNATCTWLLIIFFLFSVSISPGLVRPVAAAVQEVFDSYETQDVYLYPGDLVSLKVYSLTRIAISKPNVIEIASADVDELLLVGQGVGETQLFIWDEYGKRQIFVRVLEQDLDLLVTRMEGLLKAAGVKGITLTQNMYERKVVATGKVMNDKKDVVKKIFSPFNLYLIDMTTEQGDLIQIDVQISELSTTLTKALGVDWNTGAQGLILGYEETVPDFDGSVGDLFKIGDFYRTTGLLAIVNAMISEGQARILSKPSIVVTNGEEATFLVGGEIPVRTVTTSQEGSDIVENITYTTYGVDVTVTPSILEDKIDIELNVEIRDIDASNAVGENVAFTTRSAETRLLLNDGQTIVLAGLIKQNKAETVSGVPFLRRIPILGFLFRNRNWPANSDQEVVISLTPRIVTQKSRMMMAEEAANPERKKSAGEAVPGPKDIPESTGEDLGSDDATDPGEEAFDEAFSEGEEELKIQSLQDLQTELKNEEADEQQMNDMAEKDSAEAFPPATGGAAAAEGASLRPAGAVEVPDDTLMPEATGAKKAAFPATAEDDVSALVTNYVQTIQKRISRAISFPFEAKQKGWEGTVTLSLVVLSDGSLNDVSVKESSGYEAFDKDAVNTARILAPFAPFPADLPLEELVVTIPIVYSQTDTAGVAAR